MGGLTEREKAQREQLRELAQKLGRANAVVNQHETTIRAQNSAIQNLQRNLGVEQRMTEQLSEELGEALKRETGLLAQIAELEQVRDGEVSR